MHTSFGYHPRAVVSLSRPYLGNVQAKEPAMSEEKETQEQQELSSEELKQVAGGGTRPVAGPVFKIGEIKGESLDDKHKDEIEIL
jgi:hypothetical protein